MPHACCGIPWAPALLPWDRVDFPWQLAADFRMESFAKCKMVMNNTGSLITCVLFILLLNSIHALYYIQGCQLTKYVKPAQLLPNVQWSCFHSYSMRLFKITLKCLLLQEVQGKANILPVPFCLHLSGWVFVLFYFQQNFSKVFHTHPVWELFLKAITRCIFKDIENGGKKVDHLKNIFLLQIQFLMSNCYSQIGSFHVLSF